MLSMDPLTGALAIEWSSAVGDGGSTNPTHITLDARRRRLYAAEIVKTFADKPGGAVHAYAVDGDTGRLSPLGGQHAGDTVPCFVCLTADGQHLCSAGYGQGGVAMFPIKPDGAIGPMQCLAAHADAKIDPASKRVPRAHAVLPDPTGKLLVSPDLGYDRIYIHTAPPAGNCDGVITPHDPPYAEVPLKTEPRHLAWHPNGKLLVVMNEVGSSISSFTFDAAAGSLTLVQIEPSLPADFTGKSYGADIAVHPNGRFVYGTNRGHDSVVLMSIDPATGTLKRIDNFPCGGKWPQEVHFDPSGKFVYVVNMHSDSIDAFSVNADTGVLTDLKLSLKIPKASSLAFA
jgi:6-phosphogluconolactonase